VRLVGRFVGTVEKGLARRAFACGSRNSACADRPLTTNTTTGEVDRSRTVLLFAPFQVDGASSRVSAGHLAETLSCFRDT
jgi:hypothetical protein